MEGRDGPVATRRAHVVFFDLVASSLLAVEDQVRMVEELVRRIRSVPGFTQAESEGLLHTVPSGDGLAIAFVSCAADALACAIAVRESTRDLALRMGAHSGDVGFGADIRGAGTVLGDGINGAKRAMDCARPGEWLATDAFATALLGEGVAPSELRDAGVVVSKHGVVLRVHRWVDSGVEPDGPGPRRSVSGGGLPVDSDRYLERAIASEFRAAFARRDGVVLLKGARQTGKTTLLARTLASLRGDGSSVVVTDMQAMEIHSDIGIDGICRRLALQLGEDLNLATDPFVDWNDVRGATANLERFVRRHALPACDSGLVWAIDEADRLFAYEWATALFALFRSWHNRRSLDPEGPWRRLSIGLAYAAEAHRFISDPHQSPFNVGTAFVLEDFTFDEAKRLPEVCRRSVVASEWDAWIHWTNGHPYLCQLGLDALSDGMSVGDLVRASMNFEGAVGEHLHRLRTSLSAVPGDLEAVGTVLRGEGADQADVFLRLRSSGVLVGPDRRAARLRCPLYAQGLEQWMR
ncbi:MAG: AAA-like domain-containing protein [Armatimonadota bacterium]